MKRHLVPGSTRLNSRTPNPGRTRLRDRTGSGFGATEFGTTTGATNYGTTGG